MELFSHGKHSLQHGMQRVRPNMTLRNMAALLGLISSLAALQRVFDTCQNKVSAEQQYVTLSPAQV